MTDYIEKLLSMGAFLNVYRRGAASFESDYVVEAVIANTTYVGVSDVCYNNAAWGALDVHRRSKGVKEFTRLGDADYGGVPCP